MVELWDVYDADRNKLDKTHERGVPMPEGEYHLVAEILTLNRAGKMLVTQRHPDKPLGNLWEWTGGSVVAGEGSLIGALRELEEEVGITVSEEELHLTGTIYRHDCIVDTYITRVDMPIDALRLQKEEVVDAKWVTVEEFEAMERQGEVARTVSDKYNRYKKQILGYISKNAWEYGAYEHWLSTDGTPQELAHKIRRDPGARLKYHREYFADIKGKKIANLCGSNGRRAVAIALLGGDVTVFDISAENRRYAMDLAQSAQVELHYEVGNLYDIHMDTYGEYFDILYLEGGILHYFHDLDRFMEVLNRLLKVGGQVILNDFHPIRKVMPINYFTTSIGDYFDTRIHVGELPYSQELDKEGEVPPEYALRLYNISEILNAMIGNGLQIQGFHEHPSWTNAKLPGEFTVIGTKS